MHCLATARRKQENKYAKPATWKWAAEIRKTAEARQKEIQDAQRRFRKTI